MIKPDWARHKCLGRHSRDKRYVKNMEKNSTPNSEGTVDMKICDRIRNQGREGGGYGGLSGSEASP